MSSALPKWAYRRDGEDDATHAARLYADPRYPRLIERVTSGLSAVTDPARMEDDQ